MRLLTTLALGIQLWQTTTEHMRTPFSLRLGLFLLCVICAASDLTAAPRHKIPVILSTDIGDDIDDTWALALALRSPELDIKLVVGDYGQPEVRARLLAKFLQASGRGNIPVGLGVEAKPKSEVRQTKWIENFELSHYRGKVYRDGIDAMIQIILKSKEPVTLLCIGPVPNIAEALRREPRIAQKARFVGMHGSVRTGYGANTPPAAEWNVVANPAACRAALSAPWDITITPLDTCGLVHLRGERYARVLASKNRITRALVENYRIWTEWNTAHGQKGPDPAVASSTLFDCVAVYLAIQQDLCVMEDLPLRVDDQGFTREDPSGKVMHVATRWKDLPGFEEWLTKRLTR